MINKTITLTKSTITETYKVSVELFKILIPVILIVKLLKEAGAIEYISKILAPLMTPLGLPGEMALVWATAILTNIYGGLVTLVAIPLAEPLTQVQATTLGIIILVAHALPVEISIFRKASGGIWKSFLALRIIAAMTLGALFNLVCQATGCLQNTANILWAPQKPENGISDWVLNQVSTLAFTVLVLFCLLFIMKVLEETKALHYLASFLKPILKLSGISENASILTLIGLLGGITFSGGLLMVEIENSEMSRKDMFLTLSFLSLSHGVVDDTAMMLLIGASLWGTLVARIIFTILIVSIIARVLLPRIRLAAIT